MKNNIQDKRRYWLAGHRDAAQDEFFVAALDKTIWQEGGDKDWDTCWYTGMPDPDVFKQLDADKTINHIPGNNGLTIKNYLYDTLSSQRRRLADTDKQNRMDYFPRVYSMPEDYHDLQQCAFENPDRKWILKPKNSSRGRGIEIITDIADIPLEVEWMVQEYIGNPHTMNDRKYVLRLYVLITSVDPLRVFMHHEGFAKLASEPYSIEDPDNPFAHLTNPDINATNVDSDAPVVFVSLSEYRKWLRSQDHDDNALFAKIKDLVTLTVIAVREKMKKRISTQPIQHSAQTDGCYELLGIDCLVDDQLKPWILECNLSPSLEVCAEPEDGGSTERLVKSAMVADMVSLLGLNHRSSRTQNLSRAETNRLNLKNELARAGQFECLFPAPASAEEYLSFFPVPRYSDVLSAEQVIGRAHTPMRLTPNQTTEIISKDELALYFEITGTLFTPSQIAGWIWLKIVDGEDPNTIVRDLINTHTAAHGEPSANEKWQIHENVWEILSGWAQIGLLRHVANKGAPEDALMLKSQTKTALINWAGQSKLQIGSKTIGLDYGSAALTERLKPLFGGIESKQSPEVNITVQCASIGYAIAVGPRLVATGFGLDSAAQLVSRAVFEQAPHHENDVVIAGSLVPISYDEAVLFITGQESEWESALPILFARKIKQAIYGGVLLDLQNGKVSPIGLPLRINEDDIKSVEQSLGYEIQHHTQNWATGGQGRFVPSDACEADTSYILRNIFVTTRIATGQHETEGKDEVRVETCSGHKVLNALLISAIGNASQSLRGEQVGEINDWLDRQKLMEIIYIDPEQAIKTDLLLMDMQGVAIGQKI